MTPGYAFGTPVGEADISGGAEDRPEQPANAAVAIRAPIRTRVRSLKKVDLTGRILPASFRLPNPATCGRALMRARIRFCCRNFRPVGAGTPGPPRPGCPPDDRPNETDPRREVRRARCSPPRAR